MAARLVLVELRRLGFPTVTPQVKGGVAKTPWARLGRILAANIGSVAKEIGEMIGGLLSAFRVQPTCLMVRRELIEP